MSPRWLCWLARLVPSARRRDWLREWSAEFACQEGDSRGGRGRTWAAAAEDALGQRWRSMRGRDSDLERPPLEPATMLLDLRHALRALRSNPGPLLLSGLSLALAIGATATMVAVVDAVDYRPLPYRDAGRLVQLTQGTLNSEETSPVSPALFDRWSAQVRSFEALGAASPIVVSLDGDDDALEASRTTDGFFDALGAPVILGRVYSGREVREGASVLVLSHSAWQGRFGGDPDVVGRTVSVSWAGEFRGVAAGPYTVVGVLRAGVRYPRGSDVWIPASDPFGGPADNPMLTVLGRLREDRSASAAGGELDALSERLASLDPESFEGIFGVVSPLREAIRARADERGAQARFVLLAVAAFVLLLAVINTAVVYLVRVARQRHDLLVRAALGAPRRRLLTLVLGQSLAVSVAAGAAGLIVASWGIQAADLRLAVSRSGLTPMLDWRVVSAAITLALVAGVASGLLAAVRLTRVDLRAGLSDRSVGAYAAGARRLQRSLLVAQVASAMVLLQGAGVLSREFVGLVTRNPGFDPEPVVVAGLQLTTTHADAAIALRRIERLPGVARAALAGRPGQGYRYRLEQGDWLSGTARPYPYRVGPGYFATLGIPLLAGREFAASDGEGSAPVAIVSAAAARAWWSSSNAVGQRILMESDGGVGEWVTIVGVGADEHVDRDVTSAIRPVLYRPWAQLTAERRRGQILVRATDRVEPLVAEIRAILHETRATEGWQGDYVTPMRSVVGNYLGLQQFRTTALVVFSLFALTLASMGIYGAVATAACQRRAEIGVRMALGARPLDVLSLVVRGGIGLALAGVVIGLVGSVAAQRILDALVTRPTGPDGTVMAATALLLIAVVGLASYLPGLRATRIDPVETLRD